MRRGLVPSTAERSLAESGGVLQRPEADKAAAWWSLGVAPSLFTAATIENRTPSLAYFGRGN